MTSVRQKIVLVLAVVVGIYAIGQCAFQMFVLMPSFRTLQHDVAHTEIEQCKSLINSEIGAIARTAYDWSAWDDTYQFITDGNKQFIESNLNQDTFKSNKLNVLYIVDCNGRIAWGRAYDNAAEEEIELPELSQSELVKSPKLYRPTSLTAQLSGILTTSRCPILLCSSPIITSKREGPGRGVVIMGRFLDDERVAEMAKAFRMDLRVRQIDSSESGVMMPEECMVVENGPESLKASTVMADIYGSPSSEITLNMPTPITAKGRSMAISGAVSGGLVAVLILCVIYWQLKRTVVARLAEIDDCMATVSSTQDLSVRVKVQGSDELTRVGENLNSMLGQLEEAKRAIGFSEERFRAAFIGSPFPIMIHGADGRILQVNERWAQLTGYTIRDLQSLDNWVSLACEEPNCLREVAPGVTGLKDGLCRIRTRNGHSLTWELTSATIGADIEGRRLTLCVAVDVTQREVSRRLLADSELRYRTLSENVPAVICTTKTDASATVLYISPQVASYFGYAPREFLGTANVWKNIIYCEDYARVMGEYHRCCQQRLPFACEYRAVGRDGDIVWMHHEAVVVETGDGPVAQGVIFDITHVRNLADRLGCAAAATAAKADAARLSAKN